MAHQRSGAGQVVHGPKGAARALEALELDGRRGAHIRRATQQWLMDLAACTYILHQLEEDPLGEFAAEFLAYMPGESEAERLKLAADWVGTMRAWLRLWRARPHPHWHGGGPR